MGFSYRKPVKMGPFRVTASKSGISYSAGVKGARVTKRANGKVQTTLSAPGTGLRYTTSGTKTRQAKRPAASPPPPAKRSAPAPKAASHPSPAAAPKAASAPKPPRERRPARPPKPAPAPKAARVRKPVRLRGRRSTTPPRIPAVPLPVTVNGNLATVTIHQGGIHIERTRAGRINGNHSADVSWHELAGIDFLDPNFFRNGHVHFATFDDPRGLTSTGNGNLMAASARNPHAVLFAWHQSRAYRQLRDLLTGSGPVPPPPHRPPVGHLLTRPVSGWPPQQPPWPAQQQPPWPAQQQQPRPAQQPWPALQQPWPLQ
jgi:hypothetical protein